jgi:hypothetical protein
VRLCIAALTVALAAPAEAQVPKQIQVSCRGYPEAVRPTIKPRVEALRLLEREAADRLRGLDTRTFPYLAGEARKAADLVADAKAVADEAAGIEKCRNSVPAVRAICRGAGLALATAIDEQEKEAASKDAKTAYGEAITRCEQLMGLQPLSTAWRTLD